MSRFALELQDVIMMRPGTHDSPLFQPLNAQLVAGELVTVEGQSGIGKSTLIDAILGLHRNFQGTIRLFGDIDVSRLSVSKRQSLLAREIGYVGQSLPPVPGLTADEFLEFAQGLAKKPADKDARTEMLRELSVEKVGGNRLTELSRGQLQRVLIAGAAIKKPKLLIFDEPTSALDVGSRDNFLSMCRRWMKDGAAILMVTHDQEVLSLGSTKITVVPEVA